MNRALPLDKLRGAVFGEPVAHEYQDVVSHIGIMTRWLIRLMRMKEELWYFVMSEIYGSYPIQLDRNTHP